MRSAAFWVSSGLSGLVLAAWLAFWVSWASFFAWSANSAASWPARRAFLTFLLLGVGQVALGLGQLRRPSRQVLRLLGSSLLQGIAEHRALLRQLV